MSELYDIVYIIKHGTPPGELRYSLRSLENFPHASVWFYGGHPEGLTPDHFDHYEQYGENKWQKVNSTLRKACKNDRITDKFWLFNDDFFILKPTAQDHLPLIDGTLESRMRTIQSRYGSPTLYTEQLRRCAVALKGAGLTVDNYATHTPLLVDREQAMEVLHAFPDCPMFRSLYGNYWHVAGHQGKDVKIYENVGIPGEDWEMVSTSNTSFADGAVGDWIRQRFPEPCKYERGLEDD